MHGHQRPIETRSSPTSAIRVRISDGSNSASAFTDPPEASGRLLACPALRTVGRWSAPRVIANFREQGWLRQPSPDTGQSGMRSGPIGAFHIGVGLLGRGCLRWRGGQAAADEVLNDGITVGCR